MKKDTGINLKYSCREQKYILFAFSTNVKDLTAKRMKQPRHQDKMLAGIVTSVCVTGYVQYRHFQKTCRVTFTSHVYYLTSGDEGDGDGVTSQ